MDSSELAARLEAGGNTFLSPATVRWWRSRVSDASITRTSGPDDGSEVWRFITSEPEAWTGPRVYTIREAIFRADGQAEARTVGDLGAYRTLATAKRHLLDGDD